MTARDILPHLFAACDGYVELRALPSKRQCFTVPNDTATRADFVRRNQGQNLYWGVATRRSAANGTEANCQYLGALFADLDFKDISEADARARLQGMPLSPSVVIHSGNGLHCYWLLREPLDVQTDNPRPWLQRLAAYLGADPACAEPARVFRIPGTKNQKYTPPRPVTVEHFDPQARYNLSDFDDWLPATGVRSAVGQRARRRTARFWMADGTTPCISWRGPSGRKASSRRRSPCRSSPSTRRNATRRCQPQRSRRSWRRRRPNAIAATSLRHAWKCLRLRRCGHVRPSAVPAPWRTCTTRFAVGSARSTTSTRSTPYSPPRPPRRLDGDPLWLLIISGSGNAKTETVQALDGAGATVTSTISSEGALLVRHAERGQGQGRDRRTAPQDRRAAACWSIKDVTSILSMNRDTRARCSRRCARSTTAGGSATSAPTADSTLDMDRPHRGRSAPSPPRGTTRTPSSPAWATGSSCCGWTPPPAGYAAGRRAIGNTGDEDQMRAELASAVGAVYRRHRPDADTPDRRRDRSVLQPPTW